MFEDISSKAKMKRTDIFYCYQSDFVDFLDQNCFNLKS